MPPDDITSAYIDPTRQQTQFMAIEIEGLRAFNNMTADFLRVTSMQGKEGISTPFEINLVLRANDVEQLSLQQIDQLADFDTTEAISLHGRLRLNCPVTYDRFTHQPLDDNPHWEDDTAARFFHGIISSMVMSAPGEYQLTLSSPFHPLTLRNKYHVYHDCDIKKLLTELLDNETKTTKVRLEFRLDDGLSLTRTQDWLQAGETDFAFMQRVIQHASLFYYFIHQQDYIEVVFSNRPTSLKEVNIPQAHTVPLPLKYSYSHMEKLGATANDLFMDMRYEIKQMPTTVGAILTREEAQWESNNVAGYTSYDGEQEDSSDPQFTLHHRYAYGTNRDEAEAQLKKTRQKIATEQGTLSGTVTTNLLSPGYTFELVQPLESSHKHQRLMRQSFNQRTFVVTQIQHSASDQTAYKGEVQATEVNPETDSNSGTLLSPFSIDQTQQGSVLAKVVKTAVPKGWRYREKSNFQVEQSQYEFNDEAENETGCLVQFATARNDDEAVWVRLSQGMQTAPEVGAMVVVSRGNNDSELPEISVIASHGSKTIQPPDRRSQSWTAHTSWGSNYSVSYGDGISLRYGYSSPVNFDDEKKLVENAYDGPDMHGYQYDNASYSSGGGFSVNTSNQGAEGVSSASISLGSNYNESHAKKSYSYSDIKESKSVSQVGKTVSCSVIGAYDGTADLNSPSFIDGKMPESRTSKIADSLQQGDSYSEHHAMGRSISVSGNGTSPPEFNGTSAQIYSHSAIQGDTVNISSHMGDSDNQSLVIGNGINSSVNLGDTLSMSTQVGGVVGINNFIGSKVDLSTNISSNYSASTNISSAISNELYCGNRISTSTSISDTIASVTSISASNQFETSIGESNAINTRLSESNAINTNIGVSNSIDTYLGSQNSVSVSMASKNATEISMSTSNTTSLSMSTSISDSVSMGMSISNSTALSIDISNSVSAGISIKNAESASLIMETETAPIRLRPTKPSITIDMESGPNINMLVMEIKM